MASGRANPSNPIQQRRPTQGRAIRERRAVPLLAPKHAARMTKRDYFAGNNSITAAVMARTPVTIEPSGSTLKNGE